MKKKGFLLLVILQFVFCKIDLLSQDTVSKFISDDFLLSPESFKPFDFKYSIGLNLTILPLEIVEEEIRQSPMLDFQARYGLPFGFSIKAQLATNYLTYLGALSVLYSLDIGQFGLGFQDKQTYWRGFSSIIGFDVLADGWMNFPSLSLGFRTSNVRLSLLADLQFLTYQRTIVGETLAKSSRNQLNGFGIGATIEQPFWKNTDVVLGMKINYQKSSYQSWLAFTTFEKFFAYPEFTFAFIF
ncbi:MAG: hypothetical protein IPP08_09100 [Chlorobiota bacterium]|nr:hypothetical protein [Chlorobiota bacterium]QQS65924.1 MAG: hypothetical protein IPP08_09100 [Chlorobiota bacterium]